MSVQSDLSYIDKGIDELVRQRRVALRALEAIAEPQRLVRDKESCRWCGSVQGHRHDCPTLRARRAIDEMKEAAP